MRISGSKEIGPKIREVRKALGLTLESLAQKVGTSTSYLSQLERSVITNPSSEMLEKIGTALDLHISLGRPAGLASSGQLEYQPPMQNVPELRSRHTSVRELESVLEDEAVPEATRTLLDQQVQALVDLARNQPNE